MDAPSETSFAGPARGTASMLPDPLVAFTDEASMLTGGEEAMRVRGLAPLVTIAFVVGIVGSTRIGTTTWVWTVAGVVAGASLIVGLIARHRSKPPAPAIARAESLMRPWKTYPSARVRCFGKPEEIAHVLALGPIEDRMFEPLIVRAIAPVQQAGLRKWVGGLAAVLAFIAVRVAWSLFDRHAGCCFFDLMIAGPIGLMAGGAAFPTYLRVVPGRVDVLEFGWLGQSVTRVHRFDLRSDLVMVDLQQHVLVLQGAALGPRLAFGGVWNPWGFAHALLTAAVSTRPAPPLPDHALLG